MLMFVGFTRTFGLGVKPTRNYQQTVFGFSFLKILMKNLTIEYKCEMRIGIRLHGSTSPLLPLPGGVGVGDDIS